MGQRGNRREAIFHDDDDRCFFLPHSRSGLRAHRLAERLRMRSAANVSQQMRRLDRKRALGRVTEAMKLFFGEVDSNET